MLAGVNEDLALPLLTQRPVLKAMDRPYEAICGRKVMVTGAGGSIGSELVKQIVRSKPASLTLIDQSELNLYEIDTTISLQTSAPPTASYLIDVRDAYALEWAFHRQEPDIVFHAAALKHVPMLEDNFNLTEAVRTNVLGTKNVTDMCVAYGADMVMVSTDKAVNPSSCMGLTKRVAELYVLGQAASQPDAGLAFVRFGNVLGSSGSVVPLFRRQIAQGGPVTVTHPEMTRYMMTISEAASLTLCAAALKGHRQGCFVLDMGKPIKIVDLARSLIEMSGLRPGEDVAIEITGVRPGEKLHEELNYSWETLTPTTLAGVRQARIENAPAYRLELIDDLLARANARSGKAVREVLLQLVPEYVGQGW